jgi:hypothetical protein
MPKHVYRSGKPCKVTQMALAKEALNGLVTRKAVCINDGICTVNDSLRKDRVGLWRTLATDCVNISEVAREHDLTSNQIAAFRQWLTQKGYYRTGRGVYSKPESE